MCFMCRCEPPGGSCRWPSAGRRTRRYRSGRDRGRPYPCRVLPGRPIRIGHSVVGAILGVVSERRLRRLSETAERIIAGDLSQRLPADPEGSELDRLCAIVNRILRRLEEGVAALRNAGENIAHDLRTPLTAVRARLETGGRSRRIGQPDRSAHRVGHRRHRPVAFDDYRPVADRGYGTRPTHRGDLPHRCNTPAGGHCGNFRSWLPRKRVWR